MKRASSSPARIVLLSIGVLLWMTIILAAFFWVNKPFNLPFARALGGTIIDVATMAAFVVIAAGLGRWILRRFSLPDWSVAERIAAAGLLGLAALSPLVLIVGVVALNAVSMIVLLGLVAAITRTDLRGWIQDFADWLQRALRFPQGRWEWFLTISICIMILLALLLAILPPVKWDVLTYHLAGAQDYIRHGRFYANMENHYLGFPQEVDALYAAQLAVTGRLTGSALLHWAMGVLTVMMVGAFAAHRFGVGAGLAAAATLLVGKSIWLELTFAYADLLPMGLAIVGVAIIDQQRLDRQRNPDAAPDSTSARPRTFLRVPLAELGSSFLLGGAAGFAMGTKYTVLWMGVALGLLTLWTHWRGSWRRRILAPAAYGLAAVLTLAPWLVRNTLWYDSPVYPLAIEAAEMDSIRQAWYEQTGTGLLFTEDAWQVPILPITATVLGVEGAGDYAHDIGPLFLILSPLAILSWSLLTKRERSALLPAAAFVGIITLIWIVNTGLVSHLNQRTRFVFYLFPPLAVIAGVGLESLRRWPTENINLGFIVRSGVAFTIVLTMINYAQTVNRGGFPRYFSGRADYQQNYLYDGLGWYYEAIQQINGLPEGSTVRFLWEPRYLYCDAERVACRADSLMDGWYYARRITQDASPSRIAQAWRAEGIDYLLVYEFGRVWNLEQNPYYQPGDWDAWDTFAREDLVEIWRGQMGEDDVNYILYRWRDS